MRLAYADPPYPGKAHLYPENTEVHHGELIDRLDYEYDGWALSTDEQSLGYVLGMCPPRVRVLAWCVTNAPPLLPYPIRSWEPVIVKPARVDGDAVRSYLLCAAPTGFSRIEALTGQKPRGFCEWVIRSLGAEQGDTLDDIYPGTGSMGAAFETFATQPALWTGNKSGSHAARMQLARKQGDTLPGIEPPPVLHKVRQERRVS